MADWPLMTAFFLHHPLMFALAAALLLNARAVSPVASFCCCELTPIARVMAAD